MATALEFDSRMMLRAIALARRGEGWVEPNPMVGCVIVHNDQIVGEGFHARFGGPHAEVAALSAAGDHSNGSTLYVTLEPCCHFGKTPPCTNAILQGGVQRVVVAQPDPYAQVAGGGIAQLRAANITVDIGVGRAEAEELNAPYLKRMKTGLPWIIAKWAMSLDGKIATRTGDSRWISNEASRRIAHQLRGRMDAIMVGKQTVLADDPLLTARPPGPRTPTRVVMSTNADIPHDRQLIATAREIPVIVAVSDSAPRENMHRLREAGCEIWIGPADRFQRLQLLLRELAQRGMTNVLIEGGAALLGSLFDNQLVDEIHVFIAPKIVGGSTAISSVMGIGAERIAEVCSLSHLSCEPVDDDLYVWGRVKKR